MCRNALLFLALTLGACASTQLPKAALDRVHRPAFISRIEEGAGPRSRVFREDASYAPKLRRLEPQEADRRLAAKLGTALTRFELAERLRVGVQGRLPPGRPWSNHVPPAAVATVLQSFLVEEVPANAPDYELLRPLGADAVVELVVQEYGMRSQEGRAGVYLRGYGRMFQLGGGELWRRPFALDGVAEGADMDPLRVARETERYRVALIDLLDRVAAELATSLSPPDRSAAPGADAPAAPADSDASDAPREPPPPPPLPPGELPPPDDDAPQAEGALNRRAGAPGAAPRAPARG